MMDIYVYHYTGVQIQRKNQSTNSNCLFMAEIRHRSTNLSFVIANKNLCYNYANSKQLNEVYKFVKKPRHSGAHEDCQPSNSSRP
jgi:hypothetical protein